MTDVMPDEYTSDPEEIKRRRRYAKRRFNAESAPPELVAADVPQEYWPTKFQYGKYWRFIFPRMGVTPEGIWYAKCIIHGGVDDEKPSAMIGFHVGSMKCLGEPSCCAPARSMTLARASDIRSSRIIKEWTSTDAETG